LELEEEEVEMEMRLVVVGLDLVRERYSSPVVQMPVL
jgi:hypothetical protein